MERLELIGPPGVGKTTVMGALQQALLRQGRAVLSARWVPLVVKQEQQRAGLLSRRLESWFYGRQGLQRWMRHKYEKEMVRGEYKRLREAASPWPEFLAHGLENAGSTEVDPALRLERLLSFIRQVALAHAVDRLPGRELVLFDEGLAQRGVSLGQGSEPAVSQVYFRLMPLPKVVINVTAPTEVIHARLTQRNPAVQRFHAMVESARAISEDGCRMLAQRGAVVVRVDTGQRPREAVAKAAALIGKACAG
ncbi:hypothetical protein [Desulfurivibrio alkaliphilus]|uniref:Uncharacterized protein n=1 Tax=Desulfurivibrio alkaliphilus (strain DSM 19089 / UNIQEM U267 / AHT2) TaxID=589865 RepID=D6Z2L2_DESAT|nr:hypothetical protein [Desulfurivibrio alkaliphilus]ADH85787.1 hypothetical protein DaAHT2_1089 [Desulfurivibrio alkaliphilus AHT 2]